MAGDQMLHTDERDERQLPDITDQVAERLFRSLELMEADYQRTLAAEPAARQPLEPTGLLAELGDAEQEEDCEDAMSACSGRGYAALGSDAGSDADDEARIAIGQLPASAEDWSNWQSGTDEVQPNCTQAFSPPARPPGGQENVLECFANFAPSNPALPGPPQPPAEAKLLTEEEVHLIKETMKQIQPTPPAWATRLSDEAFRRMIKESLRA
mmetsp:Transcript_29459/g.68303  ORF Transcript_29459/g.68303 Transcript_29459/m.68303 type:complete len:212 (+) Transcript_29459:21-656(+)